MDAARVRKNWTPVSLMSPPILSRRPCRSSTGGVRKETMTAMATPDRIETQGFAVIERVFEEGEIDAISGALSGACLPRGRAGARHLMQDPTVAKVARDARLLSLVRSVLGAEAVPYRATL